MQCRGGKCNPGNQDRGRGQRGAQRAGVGQGGACSRQNQQLEAEPRAGTRCWSALCSEKNPGFQARDRQLLLPLIFCSFNFPGSAAPGSALAHVHDTFLVTGTVACSQSKAVRGAVGRCPRELGWPQGWSPSSSKAPFLTPLPWHNPSHLCGTPVV